MHRGFLKIYRKLLDWEWFQDAKTLQVFMYFLLNANYVDKTWKGILIKRGQLLTGRDSIAKATGLSTQSVRTCINRLKSTSEITSQPTNRYSIITLCNYETYNAEENNINQPANQPTNQQLTSKQPASNQQSTTTNKDNKEKKDKKGKNSLPQWKKSLEDYKKEIDRQWEILKNDSQWWAERKEYHPKLDIELSVQKALVDFWYREEGWEYSKKKKKGNINLKLTLSNALTVKCNQVWSGKK